MLPISTTCGSFKRRRRWQPCRLSTVHQQVEITATPALPYFRRALQPISSSLMLAALVACGSPPVAESRVEAGQTGATPLAQAAPSVSPVPQRPTRQSLATRLAAIDRAVERWAAASTLADAHQAAEEARNLIVGPSGPFYGDANKDGQIAGASEVGVLPGLNGQKGLAAPGDNACVVADILGGSWEDPARRWSQLQVAITRWAPARNTFPSLPSHPQRVVGWASLTLQARTLADAHEYASHARLHVGISDRALTSCRR